MTLEVTLFQRADAKCELCGADNDLAAHTVQPVDQVDADHSVLLCPVCKSQVEETADIEVNHWRCLNDSMWSQLPAVQVTAWRMLNRLSDEAWARDLLDMMYMEDDVRTWAEAGLATDDEEEQTPCKDSNGNILSEGDTVTLIKDLDVKGGGFTAKRGTAVRNIHLTDNPEHIEGRVNGTSIVLLTCFLKKA